jgi:hypothetical protein
MIWATRPRCHVDRTACAWLIRSRIDPEAEFVFVDDVETVPPDATAFDMQGAALSHHEGHCSFETFLLRYELQDPALHALARIVHEADVANDRFYAPEARGLDAIVRGMGRLYGDLELIDRMTAVYDGLYAELQHRPESRRAYA